MPNKKYLPDHNKSCGSAVSKSLFIWEDERIESSSSTHIGDVKGQPKARLTVLHSITFYWIMCS